MKIPFLQTYFAAKTNANTRKSMRGYRILKESGRLELIINIKDELTNTQLKSIKEKASPFFFGAGVTESELVLRQFLVARLLTLNFNKKILSALATGNHHVSYPLPPEWRKVMEKHGFIADMVANRITWKWYVFLYMLHGIVNIARLLLGNVKEMITPSYPKNIGQYAYLLSINANNLPKPDENNISHDIITWYNNWAGRPTTLNGIYYTIPSVKPVTTISGMAIKGVSGFMPPLTKRALLKFIFWNIGAIFMGCIHLFTSRYWYPLLLGEAAASAQVRLQELGKLAHDYLFNNANWIYRPLWSYDAEKLGSRIIFYFYSTNIESFKKADGYGLQAYSWQLISWPYYLVWDEYQADFVRRASGNNAKINVVGPVWFSTSNTQIPVIDSKSIVVFDINPLRDAKYHAYVESPAYLIPSVINKFLLDIYTVAQENDLVMVLKRKREIGSRLNKQYKKVIDDLSVRENFNLVDIDVAPFKLIEKSWMVISLPFTSTALIAKELGKPACYYDSAGIIQHDDRAAHGVDVVCGLEELRAWVLSVLDKDTQVSVAQEYSEIR